MRHYPSLRLLAHVHTRHELPGNFLMANKTDSQRYTEQHPESIRTAPIKPLPNNADPITGSI